MSQSFSIIDDEKKRKHEELFKKNHILKSLVINVDSSVSKSNKSLNSSIEDSNDSLNSDISIITHHQVQNDPKTPLYREEYRRKLLEGNFSPIPTTSSKFNEQSTPLSGFKSKLNLHKKSLTNRILSYSSSSSPESLKEVSTPIFDEKPRIVNSILKKNVNYDKITSKKLVELKPELSSALNSDGELNPLKASKKIVISPKKEYITSNSAAVTRSAKFSSPLTDAIDGKASRKIKSPYIKRSTKKKPADTNIENDWLDEDDLDSKLEKKERKKKKKGLLKQTLNTLVDPQLPYVLSLYLQLLFNVVLVSILLFFIYSFISTVKADVENKVDSYASDILQEIALCSREYIRNNCQPGQRVVALEAACSEWEKCMNRDPTTVGRAKVGAETFAEIINGFIKPISWKSMFFLLLITVGSLVLTNAAFGTYRNYTHPEHAQQSQQPQQSQQQQQQQIFHTPYQQQIQYNPGFTRYYTPKATSPSGLAIVRHKSRSSRKPTKNRHF